MERLIFHVDVNSAFLSWEAAKRVKMGLPDLRDIPSVLAETPVNVPASLSPSPFLQKNRNPDRRAYGYGFSQMSESCGRSI